MQVVGLPPPPPPAIFSCGTVSSSHIHAIFQNGWNVASVKCEGTMKKTVV